MRGLFLFFALALMGCGDGAPKWSPDAKLVSSDIKGDRVTLEWPAPVDADGIKAYAVRQDATLLAQIEGDVTRYEAVGLKGTTSYAFEVTALDTKGNWSTPLKLSVTTGDAEPPNWPDDAKVDTVLESKGMLGTAVTFTWSEATDNVKVTKYRIVRGEETLGEVPAVGREFVYQSVDTDGSYEIQAGDDAGNWSSNGPSARVWANNGFRPGLLGNQNPGFMAPALMNPNGLQVNP